MEPLQTLTRQTKRLGTIVAIATPIAVLIGAGFWYYNNIWRPNVKVISADYKKGTADIQVGKKMKKLYNGSTISAGGGWGVRFGSNNPYADQEPNRIELVKNELTYKIF